MFHLDIRGLPSGTYLLKFTAANDPAMHSVRFEVG